MPHSTTLHHHFTTSESVTSTWFAGDTAVRVITEAIVILDPFVHAHSVKRWP
jgi:hypothetical protein